MVVCSHQKTWLGCLFILACGGHTGELDHSSDTLISLRSSRDSLTSLHFTTSGSLPGNPPPAVDVTVTDPVSVRSVYDATLSFSVFPPGSYNCPADFGVKYHLGFFDGPNLVLEADADPNGCEPIQLAGLGVTLRGSGAAYFGTVAGALGISEAEIYPYTPSQWRSTDAEGGACRTPAGADIFNEAGGYGCAARPAFNICQVPSGGVVEADGAIVGPDGKLVIGTCKDACSASEYALNCGGGSPIDLDSGAATPDPSLGCNVIPIPGNTPWSVNYCCPCAQ